MHKNPKNAFEWFENAIEHFQLKNYEQSKLCYEETVKRKNDESKDRINVAALYGNKGGLHLNLGEKQEAIKCYEEAIKAKTDKTSKYTNFTNIYFNKAFIHEEFEQFDQSIKSYEAAIKFHISFYNKKNDQFNVDAHQRLAKIYFQQSKINHESDRKELALEYITKSIFYNESLLVLKKDLRKEIKTNLAYAYYIKAKYLDKTDISEAITSLKQAIKYNRDFNDSYIEFARMSNLKGIEKTKSGNKEDILKYYDKIAGYIEKLKNMGYITADTIKALNHSLAEIYFNQGILYNDLSSIEDSIKYYKKSIEAEINYPYPYSNLSNILLQKSVVFHDNGQFVEAKISLKESIKYVSKLIELNPEFNDISNYLSNLNHKLGLLNNKLGQINESIESYKKALEYNDKDVETYRQLGQAFQELDMYEESLSCLEKLIELEPENIDYIINQGCMLNELKRYDAALDCANKLLSMDPENPDSLFLKGIILYDCGNYNESENFIKLAEEKGYTKPNLYFTKALFEYQRGQYFSAKELINRSIELGINSPNIYNYKGIMNLKLGKYNDSIMDFDKAIELAGNLKFELFVSHSNKGTSLTSLGRYDDAIESCKKALVMDFCNLQLLSILSLALYYKGQYEEALRCYEITKTESDDENDDEGSSGLVISKKDIAESPYKEITATISSLKSEEEESISPISVKIKKQKARGSKELETKKPEYNEEETQNIGEKIAQFFHSRDESEKMECNEFIIEKIKSPSSIEALKKILKIKPGSVEQGQLESMISNPDYILFNIDQNAKLKNGFYSSYWGKLKSKMKLMVQAAETEDIKSSAKLEGLHQIQTEESFLGKLYFKITSKIINSLEKIGFLDGNIEKFEKLINEFNIFTKDSKGHLGIKINNVKVSGQEFKMPKIVGFQMDNEIYATSLIQSQNGSSQGNILYIFDSYGNHNEIEQLTSGEKKVKFDIQMVDHNVFIGKLVECNYDYD
jgi:tetratricopeptide (TPR) repeat protein